MSNGIGVLGQAGVNDKTGIGVKGISGGGIAGGVGVLGEGNAANPQAIGVKGTSYTHNEDVGAVTGINYATGVGVYGEGTGNDGIGVAGTVGNTGNHSVAAVFTNKYNNNNRAVMELISNGKGSAIFSDNTSFSNNSTMFRIRNSGTGNFLKFEDTLSDVMTIAKSGNITTDGTVTVKQNKGIVRNSTATQMRMEIAEAIFQIPISGQKVFAPEESFTLNVLFNTAFSSQPVVSIANLTDITSYALYFNVTITDVTNTGCKFNIVNLLPHSAALNNTSWKLLVVGAE